MKRILYILLLLFSAFVSLGAASFYPRNVRLVPISTSAVVVSWDTPELFPASDYVKYAVDITYSDRSGLLRTDSLSLSQYTDTIFGLNPNELVCVDVSTVWINDDEETVAAKLPNTTCARSMAEAFRIYVKVVDDRTMALLPDASPTWVSQYNTALAHDATISVGATEAVHLTAHTNYAEGSEELRSNDFLRWIVNGEIRQGRSITIEPDASGEDIYVYATFGEVNGADAISPEFHEHVGSRVCNNMIVDVNTSVMLHSDERLYYKTVTGSPQALDLAPLAAARAKLMQHFKVWVDRNGTGDYTEVTDEVIYHPSCAISSTDVSVSFYGDEGDAMLYGAQYRVEYTERIDGEYLCDVYGNPIGSWSCYFMTAPMATRLIRMTDRFENTYLNGDWQIMGSNWSTGENTEVTVEKTFCIVNDGTDDLVINSMTLDDDHYSFVRTIRKHFNASTGTYETHTMTPGGSVTVSSLNSIARSLLNGQVAIPDTVEVTIRATIPFSGANGWTECLWTVWSDDNNSNNPFELTLTAYAGRMQLPFTYKADGPTRFENGIETNFGSVGDVPPCMTIGGRAPVEGVNYFQEYTAYGSEGGCVGNKRPALRIGGTNQTRLELSIPEGIGGMMLQWSANGYRRVRVTDADGNEYVHTEIEKGTECHRTEVVINNCNKTNRVIYVYFEGSDDEMLTTLSGMALTPCDPELKSSACDISDFVVVDASGNEVPGQDVRIYDGLIFVRLPDGQCNPSTLRARIATSPGSTTEPARRSGIVTNTITRHTSELVDETLVDYVRSSYFEYKVTAQNSETQKTYRAYVECPQNTSASCYEDEAGFSFDMAGEDRTLRIVEVENEHCRLPVTGKGSERTIHLLSDEDAPEDGEYEIIGPKMVCIGSTAEYMLKNPPASNKPFYRWMIASTVADNLDENFTIVGGKDTIVNGQAMQVYYGKTLKLKAPSKVGEGELKLRIKMHLDFEDLQCASLTGEARANIQATRETPTPVPAVTAGCVGEDGRLLVNIVPPTGDGVVEATSYNWNFYEVNATNTWVRDLNDKVEYITGRPGSVYLNVGDGFPVVRCIVGVQNGCGLGPESAEMPVRYHAFETEWLGGVDDNWNNDFNWTRHVPAACTNVIIRDVQDTLSRMAGDGGGKITVGDQSKVDYDTDEGAYFPKAKFYPNIHTERGEDGVCHYITFRPGGGVKNIHALTYVRAFVQTQLHRDQWYTMTAPLKDMYSGDFYFNGAPETKMHWYNGYERNGFLYGAWGKAFTSLSEPLEAGMGFVTAVSSDGWDYPRRIKQTEDKLITFPRMNSDSSLIRTVFPYDGQMTGLVFTKMPQALNKTERAYRFRAENGNNVIPASITRTVYPGLNLIGNPLMCHLNVARFLDTNRDKIRSSYIKMWNGLTYDTYVVPGRVWTNGKVGTALVAPMQSFFVYNPTNTAQTVTFDVNNHFVMDEYGYNELRHTTDVERLSVTFDDGQQRTYALIARTDTTLNVYEENYDVYRLFSSESQGTEGYVLADGMRLDVSLFGSAPYIAPLGLKRPENGSEKTVHLKFDGAESFPDYEVFLINARTGEELNLKEETHYDYIPQDSIDEGSLRIEFRQENSTPTSVSEMDGLDGIVQIFSPARQTLRVLSSDDNPILKVTVYDMNGRTLCEEACSTQTWMKDLHLNQYVEKVVVRAVTLHGVMSRTLIMQ